MKQGQTIARLFIFLMGGLFLIAIVKPILDKEQERRFHDKNNIQSDQAKVIIEKPLHNVDIPDFAKIYDVKTKKKQFFDFLRPAVLAENRRVMALRERVIIIGLKLKQHKALLPDEMTLIEQLSKQYRIKPQHSFQTGVTELLKRVDRIPSALILVQAANESAWGTSRFARIGLNFFGIWCFQKGCGMVPKGRDTGLTHEVAAFKSVEQAVKHYVLNINTNSAYVVFRAIRAQLRSHEQPLLPQVLAAGLLPYSERGSAYVEEITNMIRHNKSFLGDTAGL